MSLSEKEYFLKLQKEIENISGSINILTEVEDLYVYRHLGAFGFKSTEKPLAVVRVDSENKELLYRLSELGFRLMGETGENLSLKSSCGPLLIVDDREPLDPYQLKDTLEHIGVQKEKLKNDLKVSEPLQLWFSKFIKGLEGFRIDDKANSLKDFCVVQRFFDGVETYSSKGRLLLSKGLIKGELKPSTRLIDAIYNCTTCGQCYDQLGGDSLEIENAIVRARCEIANRGLCPSFGKSAMKNIQNEGNPMGMPSEDRTIWWEEILDDRLFDGNEVLYWPGCTTGYRLPGIIEDTSRVLEHAEVDFGLLGEEERCCGLVLYLVGFWEQATEIAKKRVMELRESTKVLVTSCAGCFYAFSKVYQRLGVSLPFRVLHTSQFYDELLQEGRLSFKDYKTRSLWHDPCDLGRHCGVYDPPRNVLKSIPKLEFVEANLNRDHTICCGGGGGLMAYNYDLSDNVASTKLEEELSSIRVDNLVTGCPACVLNFKSSLKRNDSTLQVLDISELISKAL